MIRKLAHACILSADLAATRRFYCDVLGLSVKFEFRKDGELYGYYFDAGNGSFIEVFTGDPGTETKAIHHFCFEVEDLDEVMATLDREGIEHTDKKLGADQSWQVWTKDPSGIPVEFHQYTPDSSQFTGRTCIVDW